MEFGRVSPSELDHIDFTLPPDHPFTAKFVAGYNSRAKAKVYVGCAKWGRPDWVGKLYPKKTKAADFFKHYVQSFSTIELNATFYKADPADTAKWAAQAPDHFRFCPKFAQNISHIRRLKNAAAETAVFFDAMAQFGEKTGHLFLQLPDNFTTRSLPELVAYLESVHKQFPIALEVRNANWFSDAPEAVALYNKLHELNVATVITDAAGRRDCVHQLLTNDVAFIRYVGNSLHPSDYRRIDDWAERISSWLELGVKTVYFFIHNHDEQYSPELAKYAINRLNAACGLNIPEPKLLNQNEGLLF
jgi:uncharacterized protein YecE (DUF72 family)